MNKIIFSTFMLRCSLEIYCIERTLIERTTPYVIHMSPLITTVPNNLELIENLFFSNTSVD